MSTTLAGTVTSPRTRATAWACDFANDPRAAICDTETTGKDGDSEIVDIALIRMDGTVLVDTLIRPLNPIPDDVAGIHGISDAVVAAAKAPLWCECWAMVADHFCGLRVAAWNAAFDLARLNYVCQRDGFPKVADRWDDPMLAYGEWYGELGRFGGYRWHKLEVAAQRFGIDPGGHRARADAETTRRVILAMAESRP